MTKLNLRGAAAKNDLTELISDYFCGYNDNESSSDSDCDPEIPNSDLDDSFIPGNVLADDTDDDSADLDAPSLVSVNDAIEFMPEKSVQRSDFKLLPSSETKSSVWRKYIVAMEIQGLRKCKATQLSTFCKL